VSANNANNANDPVVWALTALTNGHDVEVAVSAGRGVCTASTVRAVR
jgi:hypothetical protein